MSRLLYLILLTSLKQSYWHRCIKLWAEMNGMFMRTAETSCEGKKKDLHIRILLQRECRFPQIQHRNLNPLPHIFIQLHRYDYLFVWLSIFHKRKYKNLQRKYILGFRSQILSYGWLRVLKRRITGFGVGQHDVRIVIAIFQIHNRFYTGDRWESNQTKYLSKNAFKS